MNCWARDTGVTVLDAANIYYYQTTIRLFLGQKQDVECSNDMFGPTPGSDIVIAAHARHPAPWKLLASVMTERNLRIREQLNFKRMIFTTMCAISLSFYVKSLPCGLLQSQVSHSKQITAAAPHRSPAQAPHPRPLSQPQLSCLFWSMILLEYPDSIGSHLNVAIEHVQKAIEHDMNQRYSKACVGYLESLPHFMLASKQETNVGMRALIVQKMKEYLDRIDVLKRKGSNTDTAASRGLAVGLERRISVPPGFPKEPDRHEYDHDHGGTSLARRTAPIPKPTSIIHPPSAPKEKETQWSDIVGLESAKTVLKEGIVLPLKFPHLFMDKTTKKRIPIPNVILLYGPSGSGKRMLVEALVKDVTRVCDGNPRFATFRCRDLIVDERAVASLKDILQHAKLGPSPTLILIDGPEALYPYGPDRGIDISPSDKERLRSIGTELLYHIDQSYNFNVFLIFSSRVPWEVHPVLRKRFRKRIYVPLPGKAERKEMLKRFTRSEGTRNSKLSEDDYIKLGDMTNGYSGRDIMTITLDARIQPLRREIVTFSQGIGGYGYDGLKNESGEPPAICMVDYMISLVGMRPFGVVDRRYVEWSNQCDMAEESV